jgi:hypothetical protein
MYLQKKVVTLHFYIRFDTPYWSSHRFAAHPGYENSRPLVGVDGERAGDVSVPRTRVPHIWPGFGQMWEFTDLALEVLRRSRHPRANIRSFPHLAKIGPDMGHPLILYI